MPLFSYTLAAIQLIYSRTDRAFAGMAFFSRATPGAADQLEGHSNNADLGSSARPSCAGSYKKNSTSGFDWKSIRNTFE
jgi:hypothetical protein